MSEFPNWAPAVTPETETFWEATAEERLLVSHCPECDRFVWYPRSWCPHCHHGETEWIEASGRGTIYSYTVAHQAGRTFSDAVPYVLAYVELEEGPRVMTNVVEADFDALAVGQDVEVVFHETDSEDGYKLPRFRPV